MSTGQPGGGAFDSLALAYNNFTTAADQVDGGAFRRWLGEQFPGGARALDVGCGSGRLTAVLADRYAQTFAVDPSPDQIVLAKQTRPDPQVTYEVRGLFDVAPELHGTFDAVLSVFVLSHAGKPEDTLPHLRSLVAPGGRLVVVDVVDPGGWTDPAWHVDRAWNSARTFSERGGGLGAALATLRLFLDPRWLAQCAADVPLTPAEFDRRYGEAFPGARIVPDLYRDGTARGVVWTAPDD